MGSRMLYFRLYYSDYKRISSTLMVHGKCAVCFIHKMPGPVITPTPAVSKHSFYDRVDFLLEYEDEVESLYRSIKAFCVENAYPFFDKLDIYTLQRFVAATTTIKQPLYANRA